MTLPQITLTGIVVADPELRFTPTGKGVASFRVACDERKKNPQTGQWEQVGTTFLSVSVWDQMAENVVESLKRGSRVTVTGTLRQREWEDQSGAKRTSFDVTAQTVGASLSTNRVEIVQVQRTGQAPPQGYGQQAPPQSYTQAQQQYGQAPAQQQQIADPWQNQDDQPPW